MATVTKRHWTTGKGEAREAWVLAFTDAKGKRHKEQFAKKREAESRRVEVEGQVTKGTFRSDATKKTVKDAVDAYVKHLKVRNDRDEKVKTHYLKTAEAQLRNYVTAEDNRAVEFDGGIGHIKLAQLSASAVCDWRDALRDAGVSVVTTRKILASLSRTLKFAVSKDMVATNVAAGIQVTGRRDEGSKKVTPPSKEAVAAILKAAGQDFRLKMKFAAASGLRASELHALRWRHLEFDDRKVRVEDTVDAYRTIDTTKTEAGVRRVPVAAAILAELKEWRVRSKHSKDDDLVFPSTTGGFVDHRNMVKRTFKPLLSKVAKEDESFKLFNWHGFRHFAISTWIEAGMSPKTVQTFAGHSTLAVTMSRYGHLFPSDTHNDLMDEIAGAVFT